MYYDQDCRCKMSVFLLKRNKINTPSIENCKFLTFDEVEPFLSVKKSNV